MIVLIPINIQVLIMSLPQIVYVIGGGGRNPLSIHWSPLDPRHGTMPLDQSYG
jgi:hypothetical protein